MAEEYCSNLKIVPLTIEFGIGPTIKDGYYCRLTDKFCVGYGVPTTIFGQGKVDLEVVERCPARNKTIDAVVEKPQVDAGTSQV